MRGAHALALGLLALVATAVVLRGAVGPFDAGVVHAAAGALGLIAALGLRTAAAPAGAATLAALWMALGLGSTSWSEAPDAGLDAAAALGAVLVVFLLAASLEEPGARKRVATGLTALGALVAVAALAAASPGVPAVFPFGNPNHLGSWLLVPIALALAAMLSAEVARRGRREDALIAFGSVAVCSAGLAATVSRGAALALATALCALMGLRRLEARRAVPWTAAVLAAGALLLAVLPFGFPGWFAVERAGSESSAGLRWMVWSVAGRAAWLQAPLGSGLGGFAAEFAAQRPLGFAYAARHAHSEPLQGLVELGLPFLVLLAASAWLAVRRAERRLQHATPLRVGAAVGLVGVAAHALIDFPLHVPAIALSAALLMGMLCGSGPAALRPRVALAAVSLLTLGLGTSQVLAVAAQRSAHQRLARGDFSGAMASAELGLRARPGRAALHAAHADAAEHLSRFAGAGRPLLEQARRARERAAASDPGDTRWHLALARTALRLGDLPAARAALGEAVRRDPASPGPLLARAQLALAVGEPEAAAADLAAALVRHPGAADSAASGFLRAVGRPELLHQTFADDATLQRALGEALARAGYAGEAARAFARALAEAPDDVRLALRAARAFVHAGEPERALRLLERSVGYAPDDPALRDQLRSLRGALPAVSAEVPG